MRLGHLFSLVLLLLGVGARAEPRIDVQRAQLANGMQLLVVEQHHLPLVSVQLWVHVGSKNERPGATGMVHLLEHMMFKGSRGYGPEEHVRQIQSRGGEANAFTTQDVTVFHEELAAEHLELALRLEGDRLQRLSLAQAAFSREREVVREERRLRVESQPFGQLIEQFFGVSYLAHPYRWPVVGWASDLGATDLETCRGFFKSFYAPNRTTLVVVGDTSLGKVRALATRYFGGWRRMPEQRPVVTVEPEQQGERRAQLRIRAELPMFLGGYRIPEYGHPDIPPLMVAARILSGGESSWLYQRLVYTEQVALFAAGDLLRTEHPGVFYTVAGVRPDKDPAVVEELFFAEVRRLQIEEVSERELAKAKNQLEAEYVAELSRMGSLGHKVGEAAVLGGDPELVNKELPRLRAVTAADVQRVARTYLRKDRRTLVHLQPLPDDVAADGKEP